MTERYFMGSEREQFFHRIAAEIRKDLLELEEVMKDAIEALKDFNNREPSSIELRGLAALIHDYYTGVETIFERIGSEINGGIPSGFDWHKKLLDDMSLDIPKVRPAVLRKETVESLSELLRFRHVFRHSYGHKLNKDKVMQLLKNLKKVHSSFQKDISQFLKFLE